MSRGVLNLMIDMIAAMLLMAMVGTGYILWFALPPGTNRTHILWGLLRHQWGTVHFWISVTLLAVLTVHVALHWRWLVTGLSKRFGVAAWAERAPRLTRLTVLAAVALPLITLAILAHLSVRLLDPPLHQLGDDLRATATSAPPGMAAEHTAPSSTVSAQDTTPAGGLATSPSASSTDYDAVVAQVTAMLRARCSACHSTRPPAAGVQADTPSALRMEQNGVL